MSTRRVLAAILLLALLLRLGALFAARDATLVKDEVTYVARAEALLDGQGYVGSYQSWVRHEGWQMAALPQYPGSYQPPGYPTFIALVMAVAGRSALAVQLVQVLLGVASTALVFALANACFGARAGLFAAALHALYPNLIVFSHLLWSESFFIFLMLAALALLLARPGPPGLRASFAAGLLLGWGALTRTTLAPLIPVAALWPAVVAWRQSVGREGANVVRPALRSAALVAFAAAVVIAPWTIRSSLLHGGLVLIDTNGPFNLWRGNSPYTFWLRGDPDLAHYGPPFESVPLHPVGMRNAAMLVDELRRDRGIEMPTDLEVIDYAGDTAWAFIAAHPGLFVRRMGTKLFDMWNPTSFVLRKIELGGYGEVSSGLRAAITWTVVAGYLVVLVAALAGSLMAWRDPHIWLVGLFVLALSAVSALAFGLTRYRLPLIPLLMVPAGLALARSLPVRHREGDAEHSPTQWDRSHGDRRGDGTAAAKQSGPDSQAQ